MITARLDKRERWAFYADGSVRSARLLCGKRDADGVQRCRGHLAVFFFATDSPTAPPKLLLEGMRRAADGVYRPTAAARRVQRRFGDELLREPDSYKSNGHLRRHKKQARERWDETFIDLLPPLPALRAVCPRCDKEQDLLDALGSAMR